MPRELTPKARLATHFSRPRHDELGRVYRADGATRPLPPREVLKVKRLDVTAPSARPRHIEISLWDIKAGKEQPQ